MITHFQMRPTLDQKSNQSEIIAQDANDQGSVSSGGQLRVYDGASHFGRRITQQTQHLGYLFVVVHATCATQFTRHFYYFLIKIQFYF
jgi:hypothetical protein